MSILELQRAWATSRGLAVDEKGYLAGYAANLRAPMSAGALAAFTKGSGGELTDSSRAPAKMRALHSSSALAVNFFDFWHDRDLQPLLSALRIDGPGASLHFEEQLPTGASGIPPNVDVVIRLQNGGLVGVESKFTEWMTAKRDMAKGLLSYIDRAEDTSYWSRAELPKSHALAMSMSEGGAKFEYLNVPQLLKHALGLQRAVPESARYHLRYLYFDATCGAQRTHAKEMVRFIEAVGDELQFVALSYQQLLADLGTIRAQEESMYRGYLTQRYSLGA